MEVASGAEVEAGAVAVAVAGAAVDTIMATSLGARAQRPQRRQSNLWTRPETVSKIRWVTPSQG